MMKNLDVTRINPDTTPESYCVVGKLYTPTGVLTLFRDYYVQPESDNLSYFAMLPLADGSEEKYTISEEELKAHKCDSVRERFGTPVDEEAKAPEETAKSPEKRDRTIPFSRPLAQKMVQYMASLEEYFAEARRLVENIPVENRGLFPADDCDAALAFADTYYRSMGLEPKAPVENPMSDLRGGVALPTDPNFRRSKDAREAVHRLQEAKKTKHTPWNGHLDVFNQVFTEELLSPEIMHRFAVQCAEKMPLHLYQRHANICELAMAAKKLWISGDENDSDLAMHRKVLCELSITASIEVERQKGGNGIWSALNDLRMAQTFFAMTLVDPVECAKATLSNECEVLFSGSWPDPGHVKGEHIDLLVKVIKECDHSVWAVF
jgi:hypothetical protein